MKPLLPLRATVTIVFGISLCSGRAAVRYVDGNHANPLSPFTSWSTAANTIQQAVDACVAGDEVVVTNGVYATGGRVITSGLMNRVALRRAIKVRSVNGPLVTIIQGAQVPLTFNGPGAVRCAYLTNGASLTGFTLTGGGTTDYGDINRLQSGGATFCESSSIVISNCILSGNSASAYGGGAYQGTLKNCKVVGNMAASSGGGVAGCRLINSAVYRNTAFQGGGSYGATLHNCTITANTAVMGGGIHGGALTNCVVYFNVAPVGANFFGGTWNYCCTTPLPPSGTGNLAFDPLLASATHLSVDSPCRSAGNPATVTGGDIDGEAWSPTPAIGCDEYRPGAVTGPMSVAIRAADTNVVSGCEAEFTALIEGRLSSSVWNFGDGVVVSNQPYMGHSWNAAGVYPVTLQGFNEDATNGLSSTVWVQVLTGAVHYVSVAATNPAPPFDSWATAASNIQEAVDVAVVRGARIVVANGVYATGGRAVFGTMTNRVAVDRAVTVESVNGPQATVIEGRSLPGGTGDGAIRGVYLGDGASLRGFTITNGATRSVANSHREASGGGIWSEPTSRGVSNCLVVSNQAYANGGGVYGGQFEHCVIRGNIGRTGGGAYAAELNDSTLANNSAISGSGGGACFGTLRRCQLKGNRTSNAGGGAYEAELHGCAVAVNRAESVGGGTCGATLQNCTVTGNSAKYGGGGTDAGSLTNCIVYFNTAEAGPANWEGGQMSYVCTGPLPTNGTGHITADPQLASVSHLSGGSPCLGAGAPALPTDTDIDGEPFRSPPAMGCDEFYGDAATGMLAVAITSNNTNLAVGYPASFQGDIEGIVTSSVWEFGDGTASSNSPYVTHAWSSPGDFDVVLTAYNAGTVIGVSATTRVHVVSFPVHHVAIGSTNPIPPYWSWDTAAGCIQDAVDCAFAGGMVLVTNGTYTCGGRRTTDVATNRVVVMKPLTVQSVNGPDFTVISGSIQFRGAYLGEQAILSGFTISGGWVIGSQGGGVLCYAPSALVTNCTVTGNRADTGGGVYGGAVRNCTLANNQADNGGGASQSFMSDCLVLNNKAFQQYGSGTYYCQLEHCTLAGNGYPVSSTMFTYGGGAAFGSLANCIVRSNTALYGGGTYQAALTNCLVIENLTYPGYKNMFFGEGGGANGGTLVNCTIVDNAALGGSDFGPYSYGGGAAYANLINCILYRNSAFTPGPIPPYPPWNDIYSCGVNNTFVTYLSSNGNPGLGIDYRLLSNSICINAGNNAYATTGTDLDGNARIVGGTVDQGAFESQSPALLDYFDWLQTYGLDTAAVNFYTDADYDGMNNWQEWRTWTVPTNALSVFRMLPPLNTQTGVVVQWLSVSGKSYSVERSVNISANPAFNLFADGLIGQSGITSCLDTNASTTNQTFYRASVTGP